jgi:inosine/xanthosine triphosphatase
MKTIVIASHNPVKIQAIENGFKRMFPEEIFKIVPVEVASGVSRQPMSDAEMHQGALNRVENARRAIPNADYWAGIEGGTEPLDGQLAAFAWIVVHSPTLSGESRSGLFFLPPSVADLVQQGKELGEADDIIFERSNSKQQNGAIGILTGDVLDRTSLYEHAVILALVPFKNIGLYSGK